MPFRGNLTGGRTVLSELHEKDKGERPGPAPGIGDTLQWQGKGTVWLGSSSAEKALVVLGNRRQNKIQ